MFDVDANALGRVAALTFDASGALDSALVDVGGWDVGGWLVGDTRRVALPFDDLEVFRSDVAVRVYADRSREEIDAMPRHEAPESD